MRYDFKEAILPGRFSRNIYIELLEQISQSTTFTLVGMPGVGLSIILRKLVTGKYAYFVHLDIYKLENLSRLSLFKQLLRELGGDSNEEQDIELILEKIIQKLSDLAKTHQKIVVVFNRFGSLSEIFDKTLFHNLFALREISRSNIVLIFSANKPLNRYDLNLFAGGHMNTFSKNVYFGGFDKGDIEDLIRLNNPSFFEDKNKLKFSIEMAGGHYQLFQLIYKSGREINLLDDEFVFAQLRQIYLTLDAQEKLLVSKLATGRTKIKLTPNLEGLGIIKRDGSDWKFFSPLFREYINSQNTIDQLAYNEKILFDLLKSNLNETVGIDQILETVWGRKSLDTSDWSINSLVYRLRKNAWFQKSGYLIQSYKKVGYRLVKIS